MHGLGCAAPHTAPQFGFFVFSFFETGFSVALEPVLELALVEQAGLELVEICLASAGIEGLCHHHPATAPQFK